MSRKSTVSSTHLWVLEKRFPSKASEVFQKAAKRSANHGLEVVQLIDGELRRVKPDGTYLVLKKIAKPDKKFRRGQKLKLA